MKAIVTIGIPASGKSTFATEVIKKDSTFMELNRDNIRKELFKIGGWTEYVFSEENEKMVTTEQYDRIRAASKEKKNLILTDTNLKMKYIRSIISLLEHFGYEVYLKVCDISFMEAVRRNHERSVGIVPTRLKVQYDQFLKTKKRVEHRYRNYLI